MLPGIETITSRPPFPWRTVTPDLLTSTEPRLVAGLSAMVLSRPIPVTTSPTGCSMTEGTEPGDAATPKADGPELPAAGWALPSTETFLQHRRVRA